MWVEYSDIGTSESLSRDLSYDACAFAEALAKKIGAKPTEYKEGNRPWYTLPIIYDPLTKTVVTDSFDIAIYLDRQYPSTPVVFPPGTIALQAM